jgi:hypothetical protein
VPLVVIEQDPQAVFLSPNFLESPGGEATEAVNQYWQDGLAFYSGLSSDARSLVADDSGLDMIIWDQPDLVVEQVLELADPS